MEYANLSKEQKAFVRYAMKGHSILVDACIGSGKTTAIQTLCNLLAGKKSVLYLTFNKLLKLDAKDRIHGSSIDVTNYHGFACRELVARHIRTSVQECIANYVHEAPPTRRYDVLIMDEYQDIDAEIAKLLSHIKECNPSIQIIAVGDMSQKIYDWTRLDAMKFMMDFLPASHLKLEFTMCFRLSAAHAAMLGEIWGKKIVGVNPDCEILTLDLENAVEFLSQQNPGDILCLGSNTGSRSGVLNTLEKDFPSKFNKNTVWSKITDNDGSSTEPRPGVAIFTTYDGCKGMERDICVIFDWDENYWQVRTSKPNAQYEILRNVFCVAASRGKKKIVFVSSDQPFLSQKTLMTDTGTCLNIEDMPISGMFDFKFAEDIKEAYQALDVRCLQKPGNTINAPISDAMIDLSMCVGVYQEAEYFKNYDINADIEQFFELNKDMEYKKRKGYKHWTTEQKVLYLTALETNQNRYWLQVKVPFVQPDHYAEISERLGTKLQPDSTVQAQCEVGFYNPENHKSFSAIGMADVVTSDCIYELKFVSELSYAHFLQCAMYMVGLKIDKGRLWNIRTDELWEITIPDKEKFLDRVARAATKDQFPAYYSGGKAVPEKTPMYEPKETFGRNITLDSILVKAKSAATKKAVNDVLAHPGNRYRKMVLTLCADNPELGAQAVHNVVTLKEENNTQQAKAAWAPFEASGIAPIFASETTFFKYFQEYISIVA